MPCFSYLTCRLQVANANGILTRPLPITGGVIQGIALGQLFFCLTAETFSISLGMVFFFSLPMIWKLHIPFPRDISCIIKNKNDVIFFDLWGTTWSKWLYICIYELGIKPPASRAVRLVETNWYFNTRINSARNPGTSNGKQTFKHQVSIVNIFIEHFARSNLATSRSLQRPWPGVCGWKIVFVFCIVYFCPSSWLNAKEWPLQPVSDSGMCQNQIL